MPATPRRQRYVTCSREVKRWDATSRSPVYASFSACLKVGAPCCGVLAATRASVEPARRDARMLAPTVRRLHLMCVRAHPACPDAPPGCTLAHACAPSVCMQGLPTIRAYAAERSFQETFVQHLSLNGQVRPAACSAGCGLACFQLCGTQLCSAGQRAMHPHLLLRTCCRTAAVLPHRCRYCPNSGGTHTSPQHAGSASASTPSLASRSRLP